MKSMILIILISLLVVPAISQVRCEFLFMNDSFNLSIESLASLRLKLDQSKAQGTSSSLLITALTSDYQTKEQALIHYVEKYEIMTAAEFKEKLKSEIIRLQSGQKKSNHDEKKKKNEQKDIIKEALDPSKFANKMTFHEIRPGKFLMGITGEQIETEITKPFAMMATPVTQMMWARLKIAMGEKDPNKINPSGFKTGRNSAIVTIEGTNIQMKAAYPVERVSWEDVEKFINGLNQLSISKDTKIQELLEKQILGHKKDDIYDFPTEAQWEFTMRNRGNANKEYFDRDDESDLPDYAWVSENATEQTHAVATLQPRMIDGKPFFDLEGNVSELNKDWYNVKLTGRKDPHDPVSGYDRAVRGGSFNSGAQNMRSGYRDGIKPEYQFSSVGFRLVRTRP